MPHVVALDAKDGLTKWDVTLDIDGPGVAYFDGADRV